MSSSDINRPMAAAATMLGAMFIIGFVDNFVATAGQTIGLWQFQILRFALALPLVFGLSLLGMGTVRPRHAGRVLARSFFVAMAILLYFGSLSFMPIAQAVAGFFVSPIFVLLINVFVMKQKVGPWRWGAVAVGFMGILLVVRPESGSFSLWMLMPVLGGAFNAVAMIATRSWCEGESAVSLLGGFLFMQAVLGAAMLLVLAGLGGAEEETFLTRGWVWDFRPVLPLMVMLAAGGVAGVGLIFRAYQLEEPSFVAVFEYALMPFASFFAWALFGQTLGWMQALGIVLITAAGVVIALRGEAPATAGQEHDAPVV
jgi:drug/metabolite transporter (DMT)-like permease